MPLSSTYNIQIRGFGSGGESEFLVKDIKSPPVTPKLSSELQIESKMDGQMILIVPKVDEATYTEHL